MFFTDVRKVHEAGCDALAKTALSARCNGQTGELLGSLGNGPFGPNPGQEPFGTRFWDLCGLRAGN